MVKSLGKLFNTLSFEFLIYEINIMVSLLQDWYERKRCTVSAQHTRGPIDWDFSVSFSEHFPTSTARWRL